MDCTGHQTHGISSYDNSELRVCSNGMGSTDAFVSRQRERPYQRSYDAFQHPLIGFALSGPVEVFRTINEQAAQKSMLPGSFAIIPCGMPFEAEVTSSLESLHIYVHQKMIIEATSAFCNGDSGSLRFFRGLQRLMLCSSSWRVQSMKAALEPPAASSLYVGQLARAFAARLVVAHSNRSHDLREAGAKRGLARDDLNAVRDYIEAHLASPISLEDLIGLTRFSLAYFNRLFKRSTGQTPYNMSFSAAPNGRNACWLERLCR